ncbi:MAG: MerR family transcriptional regulator [Alphaproteobacteria bacterium]|nr:MerR family transcriptional regulator [Alphaproteobacteria bacterium]
MSADEASVAPEGTRAGRTRKSAKAFRTISEVSDVLDVPQHVLRFWETKFSQIRPMKRGGGRRYYRPEDIILLRGVRELLYDDGYTIKGVQKLLREGGVKVLQERANGTAEEAAGAAPVASGQGDSEPVVIRPEDDSLEAVLAELEDICRRLRKAL